uniref:C1 cytochrome ABC transporter subunit n=1 Tax=Cyanidium caldarium TaxID=2771 RepID=A0A7H0WBB2_CYACA|nr:c1 cytochrome ABC transporter subunit [Cyanidium caldarium]QNR39841.1 c1 cytochrome ABC transporter subunit [Cyanidium caldarium]
MKIIRWFLSPNKVLEYSFFWLQIFSFSFVFSFFFSFFSLYLFNFFDFKQGFFAQIMFVHVPAAWIALFLYVLLSFFSFIFLIYKHPLVIYFNDVLSFSCIVFVVITLITGSLWGKPTWGVWWVWDARLTSVFVLFLFLISIIILRKSFDKDTYGAEAASFLTLLGLINVPIIRFSVEWWNTLHQPSSITLFSSSVHSLVLFFLFCVFVCFFLFCISIILMYVRTIILKLKSF